MHRSLTKLESFLGIALLCGIPALLRAQGMTHVHEQSATEDQTDPEQLPPPHAMKGIGNSAMVITANADAQRWFNQGLNLLHDFWDYESARAFEEAVRSDRQCAMCYWGLHQALTFFHSNNQGYAPAALEKAEQLAPHVSAHERLYIDAAKAEAKDDNPIPIWNQIIKQFPDDTQAPLFLAHLSRRPESVRLLQGILLKHPNDSAANHYLIHSLEATPQANEALRSADLLARLAPHSGHMVHMPGHIYFVLGQYERAEKPFAASMRVDEHYMRREHVQPDDDWNYVHNTMYAIANFMEEGKLHAATALSERKLVHARGVLESTLYIYQPRDSVARINPELPVALRTADWARTSTLLHEQPVPLEWPHLQFLSRELDCFAQAMQSFDKGDLQTGRQSEAEFDDLLTKARQEAKPSNGSSNVAAHPQRTRSADALLPSLLGTLSIMSLELKGWMDVEADHLNEGLATFDQAAQQQRALGYREPPAYIRPVRESEGAALSRRKYWQQAMTAYQAAFKERPNSGWALYGMARCAEEEGHTAAARKTYRDFLHAWKDADRHLPQTEHASWFLAHSPKA